MTLKERTIAVLRWSERWTKTDMVYVARGSFWLVTGKGAVFAISILTTVAFARWVTPETYGTYQYIIALTAIIGLLSLPGMGTTLVRSVAQKFEGALQETFKVQLRYGLLSAAVLALIGGWYFTQDNTVLGKALVAVAILLPLRNAAGGFWHYWTGKQNFAAQSIYRVASTSLSAVVLITTIYFTDNILYLIIAFFGSQAVFDYILYRVTLAQTTNSATDPQTVPYGKHLTLMAAASVIATHLDKIILWKFLGPASVAVYTLAIEPINKLKIALPIDHLALPKLSEKSVVERKSGIFRKFLLLFVIFVPCALLLAIIAPWLYSVIFPQYLASVPYLQVLSIGLCMIPFTLLSGALTADMRTHNLYIINIVAPVCKILLLLLLVPTFHIWGAVFAVMVGELIRNAFVLYYFTRL